MEEIVLPASLAYFSSPKALSVQVRPCPEIALSIQYLHMPTLAKESSRDYHIPLLRKSQPNSSMPSGMGKASKF
jgi:hypothetical protein